MTKEKKKKSGIKTKIILGIIIIFIGSILYSCVSGELRFVETFSIPGETWGYLGRRSRILDSEEHFKKIWNKLQNKKEFQGEEISFYSIYISKNRISVVIQDPQNEKYYDGYFYNGNSLVPYWAKGDPYKISIGKNNIRYSDMNLNGIYKFYSQMLDYLESQNIKLEDENAITINISHIGEDDKEILLRGHASGEREDVSFTSNMDGDNFEIIE